MLREDFWKSQGIYPTAFLGVDVLQVPIPGTEDLVVAKCNAHAPQANFPVMVDWPDMRHLTDIEDIHKLAIYRIKDGMIQACGYDNISVSFYSKREKIKDVKAGNDFGDAPLKTKDTSHQHRHLEMLSGVEPACYRFTLPYANVLVCTANVEPDSLLREVQSFWNKPYSIPLIADRLISSLLDYYDNNLVMIVAKDDAMAKNKHDVSSIRVNILQPIPTGITL